MHFDPGSSSPRKPEFRRKPESILICACGLPFGSSVPTQAGIHFDPRSSFRRKPKSILICACGLPYGSSFPRKREFTLICALPDLPFLARHSRASGNPP
jgi:hypothetical protein